MTSWHSSVLALSQDSPVLQMMILQIKCIVILVFPLRKPTSVGTELVLGAQRHL